MHKIWLIIKREYMTRVKKKSFLLLTILVPVIIIGFYAAIIAIAVNGASEKETIAVIDKANLFDNNEHPGGNLSFDYISGESENSFKTKYKDRKYTYFLSVPEMNIDSPQRPVLYYTKSLGPMMQAKIEDLVNSAIVRKKMIAANIPIEKLNSIKSDLSLITLKGKGDSVETLASVNSGVGFTAAFLIYLMLFIYGSMVMRGVMEEKTSRIAE